MANGKKLALVLSGGAARGAYEIGVLSYVIEQSLARRGKAPQWEIMLGTSIGSLHVIRMAAEMKNPDQGMADLQAVWSSLTPDKVYTVCLKSLLGMKSALLGGKEAAGLVCTDAKEETIEREAHWSDLHRNIAEGVVPLVGIAAAATTGRVTFFCETSDQATARLLSEINRSVRNEGYEFKATALANVHASASSAIPVLFAPSKIDGEFYVDGGIRYNEAYVAATNLGATHVFGISCVAQNENGVLVQYDRGRSPSIISSVELLLASFFDTQHDYAAYYVKDEANALILSPSVNPGILARDYLDHGDRNHEKLVQRVLYWFLGIRAGKDADLAAWLLFESEFAQNLMALGRKDAEERWAAIETFLEEAGAWG